MRLVTSFLLGALLATASMPTPADACGVKLTIKGSAHKKGVARTSNPSDILLVGSPPRRLSRDLSQAGHRVEVAQTPETAKRKSYAVVITDNQHADAARQKYPSATVLVRSGDVVADVRSVEKNVARKPVASEQGRDVVAAREQRTPIAAGPIQPRREIVTAAEPKEPEAAKPAEPPKPVEPKPVEPKPIEPTRVATKPAEPPPVAAAQPEKQTAPKTVQARSGTEVYFGLGQDAANAATLAAVVKWLKASPDVQIVVEGHADPTGNPDSNMALSQRRAEWVRDALVAAGVDSSRIEVQSFGSTKLKYDASDRRNRRAIVVAK